MCCAPQGFKPLRALGELLHPSGLLPRFAFAENSVEGAQKKPLAQDGPAVRTRCVRHPFPYAGTIQSRFEGSQSQARCRATPNGSYILNVSTI